jgi:hypothetical protein
VRLEAEAITQPETWIERYRRAEQRYRRLDALLATMSHTDDKDGAGDVNGHADGHRGLTRSCRSSGSPASSQPRPGSCFALTLFRAPTDPALFAQWIGPRGMDDLLDGRRMQSSAQGRLSLVRLGSRFPGSRSRRIGDAQ